jgi:hypothetical protein
MFKGFVIAVLVLLGAITARSVSHPWSVYRRRNVDAAADQAFVSRLRVASVDAATRTVPPRVVGWGVGRNRARPLGDVGPIR